eukprot:CAMPEP_0113898894 /NCGR_PEP_ID=MMETSP0780_2-20120614/19681_1 /TAXON_ID=652834 /ORGANISM="Palpitomonas bilix" /LENGTH=815 /DNA_ID=CAMNT_0000890905 /DNA_START=9 /DNA_END=2456 /DNA_ORIENTATION=- /assembly_acc=CAM_ASM_000599
MGEVKVDEIDVGPSFSHMYLHTSGRYVILVGGERERKWEWYDGKRKREETSIDMTECALIEVRQGRSGEKRLKQNEIVKAKLGKGRGCVQLAFAPSSSSSPSASSPPQFESFLIVEGALKEKGKGGGAKQVSVFTLPSSSLPPPPSAQRGGGRGEGEGEGGEQGWTEEVFSINNAYMYTCCFSSSQKIVTAETRKGLLLGLDYDRTCVYEKRGGEKRGGKKRRGEWACTDEKGKGQDEARWEEHVRLHSSRLPPSQFEVSVEGGRLKLKLDNGKLALFSCTGGGGRDPSGGRGGGGLVKRYQEEERGEDVIEERGEKRRRLRILEDKSGESERDIAELRRQLQTSERKSSELEEKLGASERKRRELEEKLGDMSEKCALAMSELDMVKADQPNIEKEAKKRGAEAVMRDCMAEPMVDAVSAHLVGEGREEEGDSFAIPSREFADFILQYIDEWARKKGDNDNTKTARDLFIVVAGINSTRKGVQSRVQESIDSLLRLLPDLRKQSEKTEAVVEALTTINEQMERAASSRKEEEESERDRNKRRRRHAAARALLFSVLLQPDQLTGPASIRILAIIREKVQQHIANMKEDLKREEEKIIRERRESGAADEFNGASYLLAMSKMYSEMSKAALPHLILMSNELDIDLFALTGDDWKALFDMREMSYIHQSYTDALAMLKKCKEAIEDKKKDEESMAVRSTSGLRSLFEGKVPAGMSEHGNNVAVFDCLPHFHHHVTNVQCSEWCVEMRRKWRWLDGRYQSGVELERKVDEALETSEDIHNLADLKQELKQHDLSHRARVKAIAREIIRRTEDDTDSD